MKTKKKSYEQRQADRRQAIQKGRANISHESLANLAHFNDDIHPLANQQENNVHARHLLFFTHTFSHNYTHGPHQP